MAAYRAGNVQAGSELLELFYPELKMLAARHLKTERSGISWQPTLLVNELYLQLVKVKALPPAQADHHNDRGAFFALAGQIMRRLLIHHSRPLSSKAQKVPLWEELRNQPERHTIEAEHLLSRLEAIKPVLRRVVELKVFEGLTAEEIAAQLGCATVTVHRHWQFSRHWLASELST